MPHSFESPVHAFDREISKPFVTEKITCRIFDLKQVTNAVTNTRFAGKFRHFATIDSTNIRALEAANAFAPDGTVFVADEQTAGRGRGGHTWHSAAGDGLYVSVIIRPDRHTMTLSKALWISLAAGLAANLRFAIRHNCKPISAGPTTCSSARRSAAAFSLKPPRTPASMAISATPS